MFKKIILLSVVGVEFLPRLCDGRYGGVAGATAVLPLRLPHRPDQKTYFSAPDSPPTFCLTINLH